MPERGWRVAIVDSGLCAEGAIAQCGIAPAASCRFVDTEDHVVACEPVDDALGHGTAVACAVASAPMSAASAPPELLIAQVLDERGRATPATVAAAVWWALECRADLIHFSLGLAEDRAILAGAIAEAAGQGAILVAATPARGRVTFPAVYENVIRATGDARCGIEDVSLLDASGPLFGACATLTAKDGRISRGASTGAAHLTRFIVSRLPPDRDVREVARSLGRLATYRGRESRAADPRLGRRGVLPDQEIKFSLKTNI